MIAAIIIADPKKRAGEARCQPKIGAENWACADLLGQPALGRTVEVFKNGGIETAFVFAPQGSVRPHAEDRALTPDVWRAAVDRFARCKEDGVEAVLFATSGAYAEFDVADMIAFHKVHGRAVTRALTADGVLDLWLVDPAQFDADENLETALPAANAVNYELAGYVNRLNSAHDYRRLVLDVFGLRCRLRPRGTEVRPGVWIAENAEIGRGARIVAPAFIGREVKIGDDCLITRGSNVEHYSEIDFGTAVEGSSILQKTYLGIGLDLSHSIADGRILWNLRHDVTLEITDPVVMRPNAAGKRDRRPWSDLQDDGFQLSAQGASQ